MTKLLVQQLAFQCVWLACAFGGASGSAWPGITAASLFLVAHFALKSRPARDLVLVAVALGWGWALDTILVGRSLVSYPGSPLSLGASPGWMLGLWAAFALTVPVAFAWLRNRPKVGAVVGAMGGLLAYVAGVRIGALSVGSEAGWAAIALGWALAMPALVAVSDADGIPRLPSWQSGSLVRFPRSAGAQN